MIVELRANIWFPSGFEPGSLVLRSLYPVYPITPQELILHLSHRILKLASSMIIASINAESSAEHA